MKSYIDLDCQSCDRIIGLKYTGNGEYQAVFDNDEVKENDVLVSKDTQGFDNHMGCIDNVTGDITVIPMSGTKEIVKEVAGLRGTSKVRTKNNIRDNKCGNN